jgi:hypothetical protein
MSIQTVCCPREALKRRLIEKVKELLLSAAIIVTDSTSFRRPDNAFSTLFTRAEFFLFLVETCSKVNVIACSARLLFTLLVVFLEVLVFFVVN